MMQLQRNRTRLQIFSLELILKAYFPQNSLQSPRGGCSIKKVFLNISQNSQENSCARISFLIKLQALKLTTEFTNHYCNFIKKDTLARVSSCEFCEIFKNTFLIEYLWWMLVCRIAPTAIAFLTDIYQSKQSTRITKNLCEKIRKFSRTATGSPLDSQSYRCIK